MSHITRITAVGLLVGALTSGMVQALPVTPETHPSQQAETSALTTLMMDWLAPLLGWSHGRTGRGTPGHHRGSVQGEEKEGVALDPNGGDH